MTVRCALLAAAVGLFTTALPVLAHHSFAADFDQNQPLRVAGADSKVEGFLAKDGAKMASARTVTLPDGRRVFAGSTADGEPTR